MTVRQFKCVFLLTFAFVSLAYPQVVQTISVAGGKVFTPKELQEKLARFKSQKIYPAITDSAANCLRKYLSSQSYYDSEIKVELKKKEGGDNYELSVAVVEGEPAYVSNIFISADSKEDSAKAAFSFSYLKNGLFIQTDFENVISSLLSGYENSGYPFAAIKISSVSFAEDSDGRRTADIYIGIDKKELCRIDKVEVEGNTKTKDGFIILSSGVKLNRVYSQEKVEDIPKQLNKLRFFENVETPSYYLNGQNEGVLKIKIREKETNSFDGIIGYVPSSQTDESGYFTGYINIGLRNLFGTGRSASFRWQTETKETQELELKYSEPWLFNYPFNLDLDLLQRKQDTTYVQRYLEAKLEYLATENISAGVIITTQSTIPSENLTTSSVYNSTSFITGLTLKYDSRDNYYSPTEGIYFYNVYKFSRKTITKSASSTSEVEGSFNIQKIEIDLSMYYSFFEKQVTALSAHARELKGTNYDLSDYYQLGGTNTMRGYKEKQFSGNRLFWSNLEYRLLFSSRSFAFLFFDFGYFLRSEDTSRDITGLSGYLTGYGAGINMETSLGVIKISFALGKGNTFKEGKLHFGLLNEF